MKTIVKQPHCSTRNITAEAVIRYIEPVQPETTLDKIFTCFSANKDLLAIPVVKRGSPIGLISRSEFCDNILAEPLRNEQLNKKTCEEMMNAVPLLVEKSTPIQIGRAHV